MKKRELGKKIENLNKRVNARFRKVEKQVNQIIDDTNSIAGSTLIEPKVEGYDPYNHSFDEINKKDSHFVSFTFGKIY